VQSSQSQMTTQYKVHIVHYYIQGTRFTYVHCYTIYRDSVDMHAILKLC